MTGWKVVLLCGGGTVCLFGGLACMMLGLVMCGPLMFVGGLLWGHVLMWARMS